MAIYSSTVRNTKNKVQAPCLFLWWNERKQKDEEVYPSVKCTYNCKHCGWNPEVAAKRIERMKK